MMGSAQSLAKPPRFLQICAILATAVALVNFAACGTLPGKGGQRRLAGVAEKDRSAVRMTPEELQRELFLFVDRYRDLIGQVTDEGVRQAKTADMRVLFQSTKTSYVSSAISVVTGPRPMDALRDLLVMVALQRMVWESGAAGQISPAEALPVAQVLNILETELGELAFRVMPPDIIAKLRALTVKWRQENPKQHYVAYVRFQNLGASSLSDEINQVISSGGLLAPVEAVAREAHEARLLAERTLYLVNRMPALFEWQTTLAYRRIAASPEATDVLDNMNGYRAVLERLAKQVGGFPGKIAAERRSVLKELSELLSKERAELLRNLEMLIRSEREAFFVGLSQGAGAYAPIAEQLSLTAVATRDAVAGIERMATSDDGPADDGMSVKRLHEIAERLAITANATNEAVAGLKELFSAEFRGLAAADAMLASQVQRIFLYAVALVLLSGVVLYIVLCASRRGTNGPEGSRREQGD